MSSYALALRDSTTMLRRNIRRSLRYPMLLASAICVPVFFLLLFVGVLGNTLRAGLGAAAPGGGAYVDYLTPAIILMAAAGTAEATAVNVCSDMAEGIISRFRTMAISRMSVLTGQVVGSVLQAFASVVVCIAVAFALGFRSSAGPVEWLAAAGMFLLLAFALTWLGVAFGLFAKTPAGANSMSLILLVLPFVSSAFVPTATMPAGVRWFAENQPFTAVINTLRGLLTGSPIGNSGMLAVAWCLVIAAAGYVWARSRYNLNPPRA